MYSNWYADYAAIWKHCLCITTSWGWSWWSSSNTWQCHVNLKNDTKILSNPAAVGGETFGGQTKLLTLQLGKNIGIYALQNNWQNDLQQAWIGIDFSHMTVQALLDEAGNRGWLCRLEGRLKGTLKTLCMDLFGGKKRVLCLRRIGQIIFFLYAA